MASLASLLYSYDDPYAALERESRERRTRRDWGPPTPNIRSEAELLKELGPPEVSGLGKVANLIDLPSSTLRDAAALGAYVLSGGKLGALANPLNQWIAPLSHSERGMSTGGRELNTLLGLSAPNKETGIKGWRDDPKEAVRDIGGFATEVLLDVPGFGLLKALGKGAAPTAKAVAATAAKTRYGAPVANALDEALMLGNRIFDPATMGRKTKVGQETARGLYGKKLSATQETLGDILPTAAKLPSARAGLTADEALSLAREERQMAEGILPASKEVQKITGLYEERRLARAHLGMPAEELDDIIQFSPRRMGADVQGAYAKRKAAQRDPKAIGAADPGLVGREDVWKGFKQGTVGVDNLLTDPGWSNIIAANPKRGMAIKELTAKIGEKYGQDVSPTFQKRSDDGKLLFTTPNGNKVALSPEQIAKNGVRPELQPVLVNRYQELARIIYDNPELEAKGLFTNHWAADAYTSLESSRHAEATTEAIYDALAKSDVQFGPKAGRRAIGERPVTIGEVLKQNRLDKDVGATRIAERMGMTLPNDGKELTKALADIRNTVIKPEVADDLLGLSPAWKAPEELGTLMKMYESGTGLFKAGVLTWPARYVRDITSGMIRNFEQGMFDFSSGVQAHKLLQGGTVKGLTEIPAIREWVAKQGLELSDETASQAAKEMFGSLRASTVFQNTDTAAPQSVSSLGSLLSHVPDKPLRMGEVLRTALGRAEGSNLNPLDVRGVFQRKTGELRRESGFGPARAGDMVGQYTDNMNRLEPFLNQLKKGVDPAEAMKKIQFAQVDYSPRAFTKSEQALKRIFPFYSFTSRQIPYVAHQLATNPAGRLGKIIRGQHLASATELPMPSYVGQTGAVPLGEDEDGTRRYLTSLGLMHEDTLQLAGGGVGGALLELAARTNPMLKAPFELATGESFFQRGLTGGRDISEQDPPLGRLLANLGLREEVGGRAKPVLGNAFEHVLANSPVSRLISTAKTLTDPRKRLGDTVLPGEALLPVLTGMRFTDVSPQAQDLAVSQRRDQLAKEGLNARTFAKTYIPEDEQLAVQRSGDRTLLDQLDAYNELGAYQDKKKRERDKAERLKARQQAWNQTAF